MGPRWFTRRTDGALLMPGTLSGAGRCPIPSRPRSRASLPPPSHLPLRSCPKTPAFLRSVPLSPLRFQACPALPIRHLLAFPFLIFALRPQARPVFSIRHRPTFPFLIVASSLSAPPSALTSFFRPVSPSSHLFPHVPANFRALTTRIVGLFSGSPPKAQVVSARMSLSRAMRPENTGNGRQTVVRAPELAILRRFSCGTASSQARRRGSAANETVIRVVIEVGGARGTCSRADASLGTAWRISGRASAPTQGCGESAVGRLTSRSGSGGRGCPRVGRARGRDVEACAGACRSQSSADGAGRGANDGAPGQVGETERDRTAGPA